MISKVNVCLIAPLALSQTVIKGPAYLLTFLGPAVLRDAELVKGNGAFNRQIFCQADVSQVDCCLLLTIFFCLFHK